MARDMCNSQLKKPINWVRTINLYTILNRYERSSVCALPPSSAADPCPEDPISSSREIETASSSRVFTESSFPAAPSIPGRQTVAGDPERSDLTRRRT
jgi:hypothetical protein